MDTRLKHRLAGATIIVALVVIFLPMLLKGPTQHEPISVPMEVPAEPDMKPVEGVPEQGFAKQPDPGGEQETKPAPVVTANDETASAKDESGRQSSEGTAGESPASGGAKGQGDQSPSNQAEETAAADETTGASATGAGADTPGQWAVQVGSFREQANAMGMRDELRKAGYDVYVDRARSGGAPLFRVRVGPVLEEPDAQTLAARLTKDQGLDVLVVGR